tara:strand:- start:35526 stop:36200 length:675 start_codon:yes stop_codon:yes gene_type:complete
MHVRLQTTPASNALKIILGSLLSFALIGANGGVAEAEKAPERYVFVLSRVDLPKGTPPELEAVLRSQVAAAVVKEPRLEAAIPKDAPAYDDKAKGRYGNKPFHRYMAKHRLRPFRITVEVTKYEPTLVPNPKKPGQILGSTLMLRIFGETIPDRVMAFSGDGSATVLAEVGKKIRASDRTWVDTDAADLAIEKAIAMSIVKLDTKPVKKTPAKKAKRKRSKKNR